MSTAIVATGRRKTATARVRLQPNGSGKLTVNGKPFADHCYHESLQRAALAPLKAVDQANAFDADIIVEGSGPNGQAGAISHGLARALQKFNPEFRPTLKKGGFLTRDPRERERKKPGQPGARKRFQFVKR